MKKRIIIISSIIILALVIIGIYSTFASDETTVSDNTYDITLTDNNNNELTVPAGSSKTVIYKVTNTNKGKVKYGLAYDSDNITVKVYDDSADEITGYIDYGETKFIKLYIENTSNIDSNVSIKTVLGYENGGELEGTPAIPSDYILVTEIHIENLVRYITNLYNTSSKTVVTNNNINYNYAQEVSLMNDRLGGTTEDYNAGNIRYYGETPNNYIDIGDYYKEDTVINNMELNSFLVGVSGTNDEESCSIYFDCNKNYSTLEKIFNLSFENEQSCKKVFDYKSTDEMCATETKNAGEPVLYRIIGLFKNIELSDGTTKDLIKVIREDSIGTYAWDLPSTKTYDNNWHNSTLAEILNNNYLSNLSEFSHYYYTVRGASFTTINTDFTNKGLANIQNKIEEVVWNLGGFDTSKIYSNNIYIQERETAKCDTCTYETKWTGKIGLSYSSDYGYGVDFFDCSNLLHDYIWCNSSNWMSSAYNGSAIEWTITSISNTNTGAASNSMGNVTSDEVQYGLDIRPVFYLDASLDIISGNGTKDNPYVVK